MVHLIPTISAYPKNMEWGGGGCGEGGGGLGLQMVKGADVYSLTFTAQIV